MHFWNLHKEIKQKKKKVIFIKKYVIYPAKKWKKK